LRKPVGKVFPSIEYITVPEGYKLITVGDISSYNAISSGIFPDIIVYDGKERRNIVRKEIKDTLDSFVAVKFIANNPPSHITEELWGLVKKCFPIKSRIKIFVIGEEDLAAFPFLLEAPEKTIILYGNFERGIVFIEATESIKREWRKLLEYMKRGP